MKTFTSHFTALTLLVLTVASPSLAKNTPQQAALLQEITQGLRQARVAMGEADWKLFVKEGFLARLEAQDAIYAEMLKRVPGNGAGPVVSDLDRTRRAAFKKALTAPTPDAMARLMSKFQVSEQLYSIRDFTENLHAASRGKSNFALDHATRIAVGAVSQGQGLPAQSKSLWIPETPSLQSVPGTHRKFAEVIRQTALTSVTAEPPKQFGRMPWSQAKRIAGKGMRVLSGLSGAVTALWMFTVAQEAAQSSHPGSVIENALAENATFGMVRPMEIRRDVYLGMKVLADDPSMSNTILGQMARQQKNASSAKSGR